tara:strand:+ start:295 stop:849 length:555 start_codon:yes stop_codon:yes gene_type:complete
MATQTLIQYLETSQQDGFGASVPVGLAAMNRRQTEIYLAGEALDAGDWVSLDLSAASDQVSSVTVAKMDSNRGAGAGVSSTASVVIGVVLGPASERDADAAGTGVLSGGQAKVCIRGICEAKVDGSGVAVLKGDTLTFSADAATAVKAQYTGAAPYNIKPLCGYAIDATTADAITSVYVKPSMS